MTPADDREFWLLIARHVRGFGETLTDPTQRRQMLGIAAAIETRVKLLPGLGAPAGTDDVVSERASDHASIVIAATT